MYVYKINIWKNKSQKLARRKHKGIERTKISDPLKNPHHLIENYFIYSGPAIMNQLLSFNENISKTQVTQTK